jgi:VanZ family protein
MRQLWLLYLVLIFGLSTVPGDPRPRPDALRLDKPAHFLIYGGLAYVFAFPRRRANEGAGSVLLRTLLVCAVVGCGEELYQGLVPRRTPEWGDILADLSGGLCGALLALRPSRKGAPRQGRGET